MQTSDAELVVAARSGRREAFGELARRHYSGVHAVALSRLRDWTAAEDVAQETFIAAWTHLDQLRVPGLFVPWLLRIARNLSLNWARSSEFRNRLATRYGRERGTMTDDGTGGLEASETHADLLAALKHIPVRIRDVLVLFYIEDRSIRETARELGISENAAKKRLQRGRDALRAALESKWAGELRDRTPAEDAGARTTRVLHGLTAGPVLPELSRSAAQWGLGQWLTEEGLATAARHGWAAMKPALAGTALSGKHAAVGVAVLLAAAMAVFFMSANPGGPADPSKASPPVSNPFDRSAEDAAALDGSDGDATADEFAATSGVNEDASDANTNETPDEALAVRQAAAPPASDDPEDPIVDVPIRGIVVNEWDEPIEGADVYALEQRMATGDDLPASSLALAGELATQHRTQSGSDGTFSVVVPSDVAFVLLYAVNEAFQGIGRTGIENDAAEREVRIVVKSGEPLFGRVLTDKRGPVAGASIVSMAHVASGSAYGGHTRFAVSDDDGYFTLLFDALGFASLRVVTASHGEQIFMPIPIGEPDPIELVLRPPAVLEGRATYLNSTPAADIRVTARSTIGMQTEGSSVRVTGSEFATATDSNGNYQFAALTPDVEYELSVHSTDFKKELAPRVTVGPFQPGETATQDFVLSDLITVRGVTLGHDGEYIVGSGLQAARMDDPSINGSTLIDASGAYTLTIPGEPGTYVFTPRYEHVPYHQIEALAPHLVRTVDLNAGDNVGIDFEIDSTYTIAWTVLDPAGRPLPGVSVDPNWHPVENSAYGFGKLGDTDAKGQQSWNGYAPLGTYSFWLTKEGYLARQTPHFAGAPGEVFDEEIVLYEPSSIEGRAVIDSRFAPGAAGAERADGGGGGSGTGGSGGGGFGGPVTNARLWIRAYRDGELISSNTAEVAPDGYFLARDQLPATTVELEIYVDWNARHPSSAPWFSGPIALQPDQVIDLGTVVFEAETAETSQP